MADLDIVAVYLLVFVTALFRTPRLDTDDMDTDLEEEEEEGLLASTGRRFNATWRDITGRARKMPNYGATSGQNGAGSGHVVDAEPA